MSENESRGVGDKLNTKKFIALVIVGMLIGAGIKLYAREHVTMGFEDYKTANWKSDYPVEKKEDAVSADDFPEEVEGELEEDMEGLDQGVEISPEE